MASTDTAKPTLQLMADNAHAHMRSTMACVGSCVRIVYTCARGTRRRVRLTSCDHLVYTWVFSGGEFSPLVTII